jgi:hypothetical protein
MRHRWLRTLVMGVLVAFAMSSAGACDSYGDYCEALMDCVDGNDADIDACIVQNEAAADRASLYGCDEWFDNLQVCLEEESECVSNDIYTPENRCNDEAREFSSCMSDGGFGFPI